MRAKKLQWLVIATTVGATVGFALGLVIDNGWVALPVSLLVGMIFGDVTQHLLKISDTEDESEAEDGEC